VALPEAMKRSMSRQAEAERERRARSSPRTGSCRRRRSCPRRRDHARHPRRCSCGCWRPSSRWRRRRTPPCPAVPGRAAAHPRTLHPRRLGRRTAARRTAARGTAARGTAARPNCRPPSCLPTTRRPRSRPVRGPALVLTVRARQGRRLARWRGDWAHGRGGRSASGEDGDVTAEEVRAAERAVRLARHPLDRRRDGAALLVAAVCMRRRSPRSARCSTSSAPTPACRTRCSACCLRCRCSPSPRSPDRARPGTPHRHRADRRLGAGRPRRRQRVPGGARAAAALDRHRGRRRRHRVLQRAHPGGHPPRPPAPGAADDRGLLRDDGHRRRAGVRRVPAAVPPARRLAAVARDPGPSRRRAAAVVWMLRRSRVTARAGARLEDRAPVWRSVGAWRLTAVMGLQSTTFYIMVAWLPSIADQPRRLGTLGGWYLFAYRRSASWPARAADVLRTGRHAAGRHPASACAGGRLSRHHHAPRGRCRPGCCWPGSAPAPRWSTR
jgi:hypothetical protein